MRMDATAIRSYVEQQCSKYESKKLLPLMEPSFGPDEIMEAFDSMVNLQLTMGKKVRNFETLFSEYLSVKHSTMVNSGSSANLLAFSILANPTIAGRICPGDEVIVPAVTWSTSIFPIINVGAKPVLADVGEDYLLDTEKMKELITPKTKAIMAVHLLGNVCDMSAITDLAEDHGLFVVEDTCEALGSEYGGKKAGNLSDISTFSFYFSHHITTGEGGMLCTNDFNFADLSKILRAHGYVRDSLRKDEHISANPTIDPRFLFVNLGYNLRPMDIQAAFGIHQLAKLEGFVQKRIATARALASRLKRYEEYLILPKEKPQTRHSWFVFPITVRENAPFNKSDLVRHLESHGIETRPLVCGNFAEQPAISLFDFDKGDLRTSKFIMTNSFYFGVHPTITEEKLSKVVGAFESFFSQIKR
ncbi:MAG: DegT/DnrJ/EryC1/StrS family aminotransferase [Candidatus Micrarchaeota archaeon]